jgi:phosphonate ABC transporter permease subunit PhnE
VRTVSYVGIILVGILVYAYGFEITDINLDVPQEERRQEQVTRALQGLLSPNLFDRDQESQAAYAHFSLPCTDGLAEQPRVEGEQPYVTLSPDCGVARDEITIVGFGFRPYSDGFVRWIAPGRSARSLGKIRTDGDGHFENRLRVPTVDESDEPQVVEAEVVWPVGLPRPSQALKDTAEKMIETIFLALMATTFAIVVAVPLSFLAAYNLMREVRTPLGSLLASLLSLPALILVRRLLQVWEASQALQDWLILRPAGELALTLGNSGWWGIPILLAVAGLLYLAARFARRARPAKPLPAGLARYGRLILTAILLLFVSGIVSGVGTQVGLLLEPVLGGILGNMIGTLSEFLGLLLPLFGGLAVVLILGSLSGTLVDAMLERLQSGPYQRAMGLLLGTLAGGGFAYLVYSGISNFYRPGEPVPFTIEFTVIVAVLGGLLGLLLRADHQFPVGLVIYYLTRTVLNALRSIEPLIMGIVFVIWVSIGPFAGVLALSLHSIAALGKLYSEQVESIDPGPIEAITATGATRLQTIVYGVVPQIVPPYIAFTLYRWDINVRMSTIIGLVGGGGVGLILQQWLNQLQYRQAGVAVLAIAIVVSALDYASAQARERIT